MAYGLWFMEMKRLLKVLFIVGLTLSCIGLLRIGYYHVKAEVAQIFIESAWDKSQNDKFHQPVKPWSWADTWPVLKLEVPSIHLSTLVLKDASGQSLAFAAGIMSPDIFPGDFGNSFIAAHRDTQFKNIDRLNKQDEIQITNYRGEKISFYVDQIMVVDSRVEQPITDTGDRRLTLVTCYPFEASEANTPFRYLVSAKMID